MARGARARVKATRATVRAGVMDRAEATEPHTGSEDGGAGASARPAPRRLTRLGAEALPRSHGSLVRGRERAAMPSHRSARSRQHTDRAARTTPCRRRHSRPCAHPRAPAGCGRRSVVLTSRPPVAMADGVVPRHWDQGMDDGLRP
jgi:hypothetical protein